MLNRYSKFKKYSYNNKFKNKIYYTTFINFINYNYNIISVNK